MTSFFFAHYCFPLILKLGCILHETFDKGDILELIYIWFKFGLLF